MDPKQGFICKFCKKTFTRQFFLDNHIHTKHEKTGYLCEICKVRICRKRPHSCAVEHGVCECYVCGLRFSSSKAMFRHRNLAHPIEMPITEVELAHNSTTISNDVKKPTVGISLPLMGIDSVLEKTLFLEKPDETVAEFENHPALRHFKITENTVHNICDDIIYLKCPLCLDVFDMFESFKEHINNYLFIPLNQKNEFFDAVSEIFADMTTFYYDPTVSEINSQL